MLSFTPLNGDCYKTLSPSSIHLFSLTYTYPYIPGSYLVGGPIRHLLSLLMQTHLIGILTWIASSDVEMLTPPSTQEVKAKPKQTLLTVSRLNNRTATTVPEETKEIVSTNVEKNNQYFYETRYPELIASMIQTKVVGLSRKDGFVFMEYYNSRR